MVWFAVYVCGTVGLKWVLATAYAVVLLLLRFGRTIRGQCFHFSGSQTIIFYYFTHATDCAGCRRIGLFQHRIHSFAASTSRQ